MIDATEPIETVPDLAEPRPQPEPGPPAPAEDAAQEVPTGNQEAARWRVKLRESEALTGALQARIDGLLRREVDQLAAAALAQPRDLFDIGRADLDTLLDENGNVDPGKVDGAAQALLSTRPGLAKVTRHIPDFGAGHRGEPPRTASTSWGDVIGRNRS